MINWVRHTTCCAVHRTSLGYEPYDARLSRLALSPVAVLTSADRTDHISLHRLRLVLSRRVQFTNRFTEHAIDLQFPAPFPPFHGCHPWMHGTVSGLAKQLPSGMALTRAELVGRNG